MTTYSDLKGPTGATADTETQLGGADLTIPSGKGGRIKKILFGAVSIVEAKAVTGKLELKIQNHAGPFRFAVMGAHIASANTAGSGNSGLVQIDVDIPVDANEQVGLYVTMAETCVDVVAGIVWVSG
jgi:hypothetical protein